MSLAAVYDEVGAPDVLHLAYVPDSVPGPGEVLVRVHAAGLNPYDSKVRSGFLTLDAPFPRRIGGDLAGTVEAVGPDAQYWDGTPIAVGDEVLGRAAGAVAEHVIADASSLARRLAELQVTVAGGLHVAGLTAVSCLATVAVGPDDTVLVGGASGAVGLIAAQLARNAGAKVVGTASAANVSFVQSLGVEAVEYGPGMADRVAALGAVTAVFDCHGRDALDAGLALGVTTDRMVAIAAYAALTEIGAHNVERAARTPENLERLAADIAAGRIVVPVAATFPLDQVVEAFAALESSHAPGKIVVTP
ncbi:NADP-dependent oxidoreductase [Demequina capsici]|uniref:NADP-dependent oxidoreductase n=1 Tax=Demequina capsici TaxID=3075620 RepID=A0AA96J8R7_9MICO|nr:NADP-dependent oxidoreductase [Demequina sp. OYTSA14]WNM25348.1 NADP-dependent oxidoreductase [Demequina sp. OYTSA14]